MRHLFCGWLAMFAVPNGKLGAEVVRAGGWVALLAASAPSLRPSRLRPDQAFPL